VKFGDILFKKSHKNKKPYVPVLRFYSLLYLESNGLFLQSLSDQRERAEDVSLLTEAVEKTSSLGGFPE